MEGLAERYRLGNNDRALIGSGLELLIGGGYSTHVTRLGARGQILIPSLFVLPTLFLFVYLIFETAKLSREKIRHQFAVDAASFVEMTNYSDFLNRSAYVNGAFPQRIFAEGFLNTMIDRKNNGPANDLFDIMYDDGDFPSIGPSSSDPLHNPTDNNPSWKIVYTGCNSSMNANPPQWGCGPSSTGGATGQPTSGNGGSGELDIITLQNAIDYWISWDDASDIYNLYVQIYSLLGSVEDAQYAVWMRLTHGSPDHTFFRKSYWLNTADNPYDSDPGEGARYFNAHSFKPKATCVESIMFYGNKPTQNPFQPYQIFAPPAPIQQNQTMKTAPNACDGLFQNEAVPDGDLRAMDTPHDRAFYRGYNIVQHYRTWTNHNRPPNYFNVDFDNSMHDPMCEVGGGGGKPCVHATIDLSGGSVWPDPTPKYQTRLYP